MREADKFEQELRDHGALYYVNLKGERRPASLGAYMSLLDYNKAALLMAWYSESDLGKIQKHYEGFAYLSPGFGVVAIAIKHHLIERKKNGLNPIAKSAGS